MQAANGCCVPPSTHDQAVARLVGVTIPKPPKGEPDPMPYATTEGAFAAIDAGFYRNRPGEVLDLAVCGRTVEIGLDLAPGSEPIAVLMPWCRYRELIDMRDRIAAITGGMQPSGR